MAWPQSECGRSGSRAGGCNTGKGLCVDMWSKRQGSQGLTRMTISRSGRWWDPESKKDIGLWGFLLLSVSLYEHNSLLGFFLWVYMSIHLYMWKSEDKLRCHGVHLLIYGPEPSSTCHSVQVLVLHSKDLDQGHMVRNEDRDSLLRRREHTWEPEWASELRKSPKRRILNHVTLYRALTWHLLHPF